MALLGQFALGAAHEINNPLGIILSHTQYLLDSIKQERIPKDNLSEVTETLHLIERESKYCGGIVKRLLTYTHTKNAIKKAVVLQDLLEGCIQLVERQLQLSHIVIETKIEKDLPPILGDARLLEQSLMNLLWNAQQAMLDGGALTLTAEKENHHKGPSWVAISVKDTGVGIPKKNFKSLFTPFFTTRAVGKGTGLGLWVTQSIVEEHGGNIEVKSHVGKGTCFTIRLPAEAAWLL